MMHHLQFTVTQVGGPQLMDHNLQDSHLMYQVAACGNEEAAGVQCNSLQDSCLMHHLQFTVARVGGPLSKADAS
jgi:hypothetical protein